MIKFLQDKKNIKKEIELINFSHCKFLIDSNKIDFIKIDAEGMDIDVINGGLDTIKKFKPKLLVEYLNLGSSKDEKTSTEGFGILDTVLRDLGYRTKKIHHDIFAF